MDGPCEDWAISTGLCSTWSDYTPMVQAWAKSLATLVLWGATGRQYGSCPATVRPCWSRQEPLYQTWPAGTDGEGYWGLRGASAGVTLMGGGCGCSAACACSPSQVALPGRVTSITSVQVDGVTLDPSGYLLQGSYLVRVGGLEWPSGQDLSLPLGQPNTWAVTYLRGVPVPQSLLDAAGIYACELAKGRTGGKCQLPNRVQSVTRQGVEIQYIDTNNYLDQGRTGLADVDAVIAVFNPYGLPAPLRVISPDIPQYR